MYLYNYIHSKHDLKFYIIILCVYIYTSKYDFKISIHKNKVLLLKNLRKKLSISTNSIFPIPISLHPGGGNLFFNS